MNKEKSACFTAYIVKDLNAQVGEVEGEGGGN